MGALTHAELVEEDLGGGDGAEQVRDDGAAERPGQNLIVYGAEPGSEIEERMRFLASWEATPKGVDTDVLP